ncbi:MAG TPA: transcription antitermination factor NusB [Terriglobales bacterium]|jgi:16S rRNA (cytosine967-C5)-methyltransferase|nr:transcription antitermination factor NusB [Terriglobales bacterium]
MPISPARIAAFDILLRIEREDSYASELLHAPRYSNLSVADHGLATELVMGVQRWRSLLDKRIAEHSSQKISRLDSEVLTALRLAAYQLLFLDRVPGRAAVHESVELVKCAKKRSAVPFANAVLRKLSAVTGESYSVSAIEKLKTVEDLAESSAHPLWLVERWIQAFGFETAKQVCAYNQQVPETIIRIVDSNIVDELKREKIELAPARLLTSAYRVIAGDIAHTRAFRENRLAIQDEVSQLVSLLVGRGSRILDCCAAPGGKTRTLAERNPNARIVAMELHPHRARMLRNLVTANHVHVISADARNPPISELFDRVLADVPCSGTGTLARNPEIKWRLRLEDLADLQTRQLGILVSAMQRVSPGGRLVYSTCSLEKEENSALVEKAMALDRSFHMIDCRAELERLRTDGELQWENLDSLTDGPYLRTIPGTHPGDGFFASILEKR